MCFKKYISLEVFEHMALEQECTPEYLIFFFWIYYYYLLLLKLSIIVVAVVSHFWFIRISILFSKKFFLTFKDNTSQEDVWKYIRVSKDSAAINYSKLGININDE